MYLSVFKVVERVLCRQEDVFVLSITSLGTLQRLTIGHDGVGHGAGWYLDKVTVREHGDDYLGKELVFPCNRWLDDHEDDGRTERELLVAGFSQCVYTYYYYYTSHNNIHKAIIVIIR